jgi:hypothetical protein
MNPISNIKKYGMIAVFETSEVKERAKKASQVLTDGRASIGISSHVCLLNLL